MNGDINARMNAVYSTDLWGNNTNAVLDGDGLLSDLHPVFKENFAAAIDDAILENGKGFPINKKSLLLKHLPHDIPCSNLIEVYQVPDTDPRVPLRGQNGVRVMKTAKKGLPAGAFIGVYRGKSLIGLDDYKDISNAPHGMDYLQFELEIESYTASAEHYKIGLEAVKNKVTFDGLNVKNPEASSIYICAARYGNITALVNDPSLDPMGPLDDVVDEPNAVLAEVIIGGWVCIVMFASREIRPGEELRYSYGHGFWAIVKEAARRVKENERIIAAAVARAAATGSGGNGNNNLEGRALSSDVRPAVNANLLIDAGSGDRSGAAAGGVAEGEGAPAAAEGPLADDAATPVRPRSQPAGSPLQAPSDLAPTEEQNSGDDDEDDGDSDDGSGGDSAPMVPPLRVSRELQKKVVECPAQPKQQQKTKEAAKRRDVAKKADVVSKNKRKQAPAKTRPLKRGPPQKKKFQKEPKPIAKGNPLFTPTKEMLKSPRGTLVRIYPSDTPEGKLQRENNGFVSKEQFEAARRRVHEKPEPESSEYEAAFYGEKEKQKVVAPKKLPVRVFTAPAVAFAKKAKAAAQTERAKAAVKARKDAAIIAAKAAEVVAKANGARDLNEGAKINDLTSAVEAAKVALIIAKQKHASAVSLSRKHEQKVKELQPEPEVEEQEPPAPEPVQPSVAQPALWTQTRLFALFIVNEQGNEVLVGPWEVSQLEHALGTNQASGSTEVFLHPGLHTADDPEIQQALESLVSLPESGMWQLAELLHAAHPEALADEEDAPAAAATAAATAAARRASKRKRLNPQLTKQLKDAETRLQEALEVVEEKEKLVQEKEEEVALAENKLRQAFRSTEEEQVADGEGEEDEEDNEEEIDPEVAKINERAAGKRPAIDNEPDVGIGKSRGVKSPRLTPTFNNAIGPDGAGTSAAHAAQAAAAAAAAAEKGGEQDALPEEPKPDDDFVIDLTDDPE